MHELRKTVTILFADVVESTMLGDHLDPEAVRNVMSRYFTEMAGIVESHGGTVEKFIGDEVMAVFGVPTLHEDDALRAVRAAAAMRERLSELNVELEASWATRLEIRIGVNTGEVLAGDASSGHGFVTGDAVNVAKRIEQAAQPGEILLGEATSKIVHHAVTTTAAAPLAAKGKTDKLTAYRLVDVDLTSDALPRRPDAPLVGRAAELKELRAAYARAVEMGQPQLLTVLGQPGIGKSRLARELLDGVAGEAGVLVGRCLPYGEGITFWPVREILPDEPLGGTSEEIFSQVRRRLEALARERPLVVCFDDVHWAEPTFLDLVQYLAGWIQRVPLLILCLARPELFEKRPDWPRSDPAAQALTLGPLDTHAADELLEHLEAPSSARKRIASAAEGNPLFVEQMAAMAAAGGDDIGVPPSIRALLAVRLGRLDPLETAVIERAAVIGREFPLRAVADLVPEDQRAAVSAHLFALVRKEFIRPHAVGEDDRFRFRHALIRDAAYDAMPKALRADFHERHAAWLEGAGSRDFIVGYHLEQAVNLRRELGLPDEATARLAARAGGLLGVAGQRAFRRSDMPAARNLLGRARALLSEGTRGHLELGRDLARAEWALGEVEQADALLRDVVNAAAAAGERDLEWYARLDRAQRDNRAGGMTSDEFLEVANSAIAVFEELQERPGIASARRAVAIAALRQGSYARAVEEIEHAIDSEPGDKNAHARNADVLATALLFGPTPAPTASRRCRRLLEHARENVELEAHVSSSLAGLEAMQDRFDQARILYARSRQIYLDLGLRMPLIGLTQVSGLVELLAGEPEAAERELRDGYEQLLAIGGTGYLAPQAPLLALALLAQERGEEAALLVAGDKLTEDIPAQILTWICRSRIDLQRGEPAKALETAKVAVALAEQTDGLNITAEALTALALACVPLDLSDRARSAVDRSLVLYRRKGNLVAERQAEALLAEVAI
jgi:class 3 adenylate cyclase/tetratricopeptide (TPR) repeat protein